MIDSQGKIKGRVSIIDILIVLAVLALAAGLLYRRATPRLQDILRPADEFYIVFEVNRIRSVIAENSVEVGDLLFRQHERQPLGRIVAIERHPATDVMRRSDGTAIMAVMEDRYNLHITIEAVGSITPSGYFVNGIDHIATSAEIVLANNRIHFPLARVQFVGTELPRELPEE